MFVVKFSPAQKYNVQIHNYANTEILKHPNTNICKCWLKLRALSSVHQPLLDVYTTGISNSQAKPELPFNLPFNFPFNLSLHICSSVFFIDFYDGLKVLIFWDVLVIDSILIWEVNSEKSEAFKKQTLECFGLNFNCALLFITSGSKVTFECWLGKANDHCRQVSSKRGARNYLELNCLSSRRKVFYIHPKHITPTSLLLLLLLDIF